MSMIKCSRCGRELPDGVTVCDCENTQTFVVPVSDNTSVNNSMPQILCVNDDDNDEEYLALTKDCKIINLLGIILFLGGIVSLLLINEWMAAIMFLVGELFVLSPNGKVQKLCKAKNPSADKKAMQRAVKETTKRLKAKDKNFNFSFIIAIICLISLVASFIVPSPLLKNKQNTDTYVPEETTTEVAEPLCYRPTVEEFMEDFSAMHKVLLVNDVTYRIQQGTESENKYSTYSIYVSTNGIEYMTMSCLAYDGGVYNISSEIISESPICEIWGSKTYDDETEFVGFAENILVTYVLLNYQNPEKYPCDTEAFGDFVMLMTSAVKNGEGNTIYKYCNREYENCTISLAYSATNGSYMGRCRLEIYDRFNDS